MKDSLAESKLHERAVKRAAGLCKHGFAPAFDKLPTFPSNLSSSASTQQIVAPLLAMAVFGDQVKAAIEPWRSSSVEPPFSPTELITMALVMHEKEMTLPDIMKWIAKTFLHYRLVIHEYDHSAGPLDSEDRSQAQGLRLYLSSVLYKLESPAYRSITAGFGGWNVSRTHARIYLQPALGFEPRGTFPFLR